jgi:hypothetical protein
MMNKAELQRRLAQQFEAQCLGFEQKRDRIAAELTQDLQRLSAVYTAEVVEHRLPKALAAFHGNGTLPASAQPQSGSQAGADEESESSASAIPKKRRGRGKGAKKEKTTSPTTVTNPSFSEHRPLVLEAVSNLSGKKFTVTDVRSFLKSKNVNFNPAVVSSVLSQYIRGIKTVGKRAPEGLGAKVNIYEVVGKLAIRSAPLKSKRAKKSS